MTRPAARTSPQSCTRAGGPPLFRCGAGRRPTKETTVKIHPTPQTCAADQGCTEVARFVVAVAAAHDGSIRAARRCCSEHLEEAVFWAEGMVGADPARRYALLNRWGPWALELREVPA
jgi:hypothetical protein